MLFSRTCYEICSGLHLLALQNSVTMPLDNSNSSSLGTKHRALCMQNMCSAIYTLALITCIIVVMYPLFVLDYLIFSLFCLPSLARDLLILLVY